MAGKLLQKMTVLNGKVDAATGASNASSADIRARLTTLRSHQEQQVTTTPKPQILNSLNFAIDALGHRSVTTLQTLVDLDAKVESMIEFSQDISNEISK